MVNITDFGHPSKVVDSCFGNGTKWISRNESQMWISGNPLRSIPETNVHYFYRDMKGAGFWGEHVGSPLQPQFYNQLPINKNADQ